MNLQQVQPGVDRIDQPESPGQQVDGPDAAIGQAVDALGDLILNIAGGLPPRLLTLPLAILDGIRTQQHYDALPPTFEADVEVHAVGPDIDV